MSEPTDADLFTYIAAPAVTLLSSGAGPLAGGTLVTIVGTNLTDATAVKFGQNLGTIVPGTNTDTQIQAYSPAGSAGNVDVTVTTAGGTSAPPVDVLVDPDAFNYTSAPIVRAVNPSQSHLAGGGPVAILVAV